MISPVSGEVVFADGLRFSPQEELCERHIRDARAHANLPVPGWTQHCLGVHPSEHGAFEVEAVSDRDCRIQLVLVAHAHRFYRSDTRNDSERRAFHEGIISSDLLGQLEFSWGAVFCRLDSKRNKDWLVTLYTRGAHIPLRRVELLRHLLGHEPIPVFAVEKTTVNVIPGRESRGAERFREREGNQRGPGDAIDGNRGVGEYSAS